MQESEPGKRGNLSASENLFLASYCMLSLTYPESLDLKRKEWCLLFIYLHLIFFLPTILCYAIISLLMKLINYGESCLRMYYFTRKHSQGAMTFWLNCLSHLSELKGWYVWQTFYLQTSSKWSKEICCISVKSPWTVHRHGKSFCGVV